MSLATDLITALDGSAPLHAVVADRIYPGRQPTQWLGDCVTYQVVNDIEWAGAGSGRTPAGRNTRVSFGCWSSTYLGVVAVAEAVRAAMRLYTTNTYGLEFLEEVDLDVPREETVDLGTELYHRALDVQIVREP